MKRKKRTEVLIVTHQRLTVTGVASAVFRCPTCAASAAMITSEEAAALARTSPRAIHHWLEAKRVHFTDAPGGTRLVCLHSVLEHLKEGGRTD